MNSKVKNMHVSLTPELEKMVKSLVESGYYNNASEVVREALRKMHNDNELRKLKAERLREAIAVGVQQLERGEFFEGNLEDIFKEVKKRRKLKKDEDK